MNRPSRADLETRNAQYRDMLANQAEDLSPGYSCKWYARCDRLATKTRPHPVLGPVPICNRCDELCDTNS